MCGQHWSQTVAIVLSGNSGGECRDPSRTPRSCIRR
jgi:hypothetical protein